MPLNKTGSKIMAKMKQTYGSKKGKQVFFASKNKGKLPPVEKAKHDEIARRAKRY